VGLKHSEWSRSPSGIRTAVMISDVVRKGEEQERALEQATHDQLEVLGLVCAVSFGLLKTLRHLREVGINDIASIALVDEIQANPKFGLIFRPPDVRRSRNLQRTLKHQNR
jgi:hypothetical protein